MHNRQLPAIGQVHCEGSKRLGLIKPTKLLDYRMMLSLCDTIERGYSIL